ncbi:MAG TPA: Shedu immune nuclease family protein [Longimicrobium sp.]|nr:Shedu immune nuclease family protein [Longimicrobium sp.]
MKISDFILRFSASRLRVRDAICRVRIFVTPSLKVVAVLGDLGLKNTGNSVTNSVEKIRETLIVRGFIDEHALIMEHYEWGTQEPPFTRVSFDEDGDPAWDGMLLPEVIAFLGCSPGEFDKSTVDDVRLSAEMERIRNKINPFVDSPDEEPAEVYNRRAEIERGMISKGDLAALISAGAKEREFQKLLKRDLSIFGEMYAQPKEEYICFSEFPVAEGFVDFALFGGRSRMDVILIEVKGADFSILNRNSYRNFAAKINEAAQQVRRRLGDVYRNFDNFRDAMHGIRIAVESGKSVCNSFIGSQTPLEVDPNKDIKLHGVIIGGRTHNDLLESKLRHNFEHQSSPPVRIESWDSWLRKLDRA